MIVSWIEAARRSGTARMKFRSPAEVNREVSAVVKREVSATVIGEDEVWGVDRESEMEVRVIRVSIGERERESPICLDWLLVTCSHVPM